MANKPLLEVRDLVIHYEMDDEMVRTPNGVNIHIGVGETLGLVGETGMGKTTLAKGIMRLIPNPPGKILDGEVIFEGQDLLKLPADGMGTIRGRDIPMIFQDPMTFPNPVLTVSRQIMEIVENHNTNLSRQEARKWAENMLERVGTPAERFGEYPHQFSGDMKQGVIIAIALACNPKLLITDGPTTALDVTIQAQMLEVIYKLKSENNASMILITHDLGVVAQNCDYVAIICAGEVIEHGVLQGIYKDTKHPYAGGLFGSILSLASDVRRLQVIDDMMPNLTKLSEDYVFCERYKCAVPERPKTRPGMVTVDGAHQIRCIRYR